MKTILLLLISLNCFSQDFEGKIEYKLYYQPLNGILQDTVGLKTNMGTKSIFTIRKGNYKQTTNSRVMSYQLYLPEENRLYVIDSLSPDQLIYYRGDKSPNTKFEYEIIKDADTILGYVCDKLIYKTEQLSMTYYYTDELKLDPKYFKSFSLLNRNSITEIMKSVFLKTEYFMPNFIATMEAVSITKMKIDKSEFEKPKLSIVREHKLN